MKNKTTPILAVLSVILMIAAFFTGSHVNERKNRDDRLRRCETLISFAIEKAEHEDLSNQDTMEALISNLYAAYELCDDPDLAAMLHDLWNTLIFRSDTYADRPDLLIERLRSISEALTTGT